MGPLRFTAFAPVACETTVRELLRVMGPENVELSFVLPPTARVPVLPLATVIELEKCRGHW